MTEPEAESWCQDFMNQSPGYVACKDVSNVDQSRAVEICVLDILVIYILSILILKLKVQVNFINYYVSFFTFVLPFNFEPLNH